MQWVRAGLALGYSHPNITGFPRSKIFIGDSVKFDQKIIIVCIVLLLELNRYTMVGDTSAGEYNLRVAEVETLFFYKFYVICVESLRLSMMKVKNLLKIQYTG